MTTLILTPRQSEDSQALWKAAAALGWKTERLPGWRVPDHLRAIDEPVLYGEALFGPALAEQLGITLQCPADDWLVRLAQEYSLRTVRLCTLGEARAIDAPAFIKPPADKSFPAAVYRGAELPREYDDAMQVLVSGVVQFALEYRCFVLDRALQTFSLYARHGELQRDAGFASTPEEDAGLREFMTRLLADERVDLPQATVVDAGRLADGRWACVEQNAAWGAGIYGCEPAAVLRVLRAASRREG